MAGTRRKLRGVGSGPIAATVNALALPIRIDNYEERALRAGADASALAIVEAARDGVAGIRYGAGRHANIATASVLAVLSAARRLGVSAQDLRLRHVELPIRESARRGGLRASRGIASGLRCVARNRIEVRFDELRARLIGEQQVGGVVRQHDLAVEQHRVARDEIVGRAGLAASDA